ncbi:MAG: S1C family serine protease [Geopsychrobacter sp.]|nr:S1C family serine protease [Geopsychrobacter sp.]
MPSVTRVHSRCLLIILFMLLVFSGTAQADERINRPAYISISLDPQLYDSNLWETSYQETLDQFYNTETEDFGYGLAEGLEKTVIRGQLKVLPGYRVEDQKSFRQEGEPNTFLLAIDLRYTYGLGNGSPLAAMATFGTCFLASPIKMFSYSAHLEGHVVVYYVNNKREKIRILDRDYTSESQLKGNFFDAQEMAQEVKWIRQLTRDTLTDMSRQILAELPLQLLQRSWRKIADELNSTPTARRRLLSNRTTASKRRSDKITKTTKKLALPEMIRQVSPGVFKVLTEKSTGSGFIISDRGYAVTSLHVVNGAKNIKLQFLKGATLKARMILNDPKLDIAVLAVAPENLTPLQLGRSAGVNVGDAMVAIGYGEDVGLSVVPTTITRVEEFKGTPLLRIDTELGEGNSGGPLLDSFGRVIAIDIRRSDGQQEHVSFAIPIDEAKRLFSHLLN